MHTKYRISHRLQVMFRNRFLKYLIVFDTHVRIGQHKNHDTVTIML